MNLGRHFVAELESAGIGVTELDRRWVGSELIASLRDLRRAVRTFAPDLIHSVSHHSNHLTRFLRLFPGRRFRLLTAVRTAYDARQLRNERWEQRLSSFVVCNSPAMEAKLRTVARIPPTRLRFIANGLDLARFATNPDPALRARLAPGCRRVVTCLARITEQKAPHLLAQAVGQLKRSGQLPNGVAVWIVGDRDSAAAQELLNKAIAADDLGDVVRCFPATQQPAAFFHASDFTVLASLWEGTPNSVLESLAVGKPALVSAAANESGLIQPGVTGWEVPTGDVPALALGLERALSLSDQQLAAMANACRARAGEFAMPTMVTRYQSLYDELLQRSGSSVP